MPNRPILGRGSRAAAFLIAVGLLSGLAGPVPEPATAGGAVVRIMPLGDSLTHGLEASHFCCGVPGAYRINLDGHLRTAGYGFDFVGSQSNGPQTDKDHEGHSGYLISEIHNGRAAHSNTGVSGWLAAQPAEVVLLMIGTNDVIQNNNLSQAPTRLSSLIDRIRQLEPAAQLYVASIPPLVGPKASLNSKVVAYNSAIREVVANKGAGAHFVEVYMALSAADFGSDGVHLTRPGHDKVARVWADALLGIPPPDTTPPTVTGRSPVPGATGISSGAAVTAAFSEQIAPASLNAATFTLSSTSAAIAAGVSYDAASRVATLIPAAGLAGGTTYTATVHGGGGGVKDLAGNALVGDVTWRFTTEQGRSFSRLAGADRYGTAAAVSSASFGRGVPVAFIATGTNFPDALAAGPAAAVNNGPVLLARSNAIPQATQDELARLQPQRIVVLGGIGAISDGVLSSLRAYSANVSRVAGTDRYSTAAAISAANFPRSPAPIAYVATGINFPDALAGGAAAGREGGPILLTRPAGLPQATIDELRRLRPMEIVVFGGSGVVSDAVLNQLTSHSGRVTRIAGLDRYATAAAISTAGYTAGAGPRVYVATGTVFPDGLAAAPVAGRDGAPLLLTAPNALPAATAAELRRLNPDEVIVLGSTGAVSDAVIAQMRALWP